MRRETVFGVAAVAAVFGVVAWRATQPAEDEHVFDAKLPPVQSTPLCPWREPEADLNAWFPPGTTYELETAILSGSRLELTQRLGREPTGDENVLHLYRIRGGGNALGAVVTRRVKGEFGGMEVVIAVGPKQEIVGLRLQRLREPEAIARALSEPGWQRSFRGKTAADPWELGRAIPDVPVEARPSAAALLEGVRSLLILLSVAEAGDSVRASASHRH